MATLHISLPALVQNYQTLRRRAGSADVAAVVKADAYGLGMSVIAKTLAAAGCRLFFVAYPEEGAALRAVLPESGIAVFNGLSTDTLPVFTEHRLIPVLNTPAQVSLWRSQGTEAFLQVETGMNRSGLMPEDWAAARDSINFPLTALMSHLATADMPGNPHNKLQIQRFAEARALFPGVPGSLAATSAVLNLETGDDLVRVGAGLYGALAHEDILPVTTLTAPVLEVREIDGGEAVGYGATYRSTLPETIATVGIGYADGLPRLLGNKGRVRFGAETAPMVGRLSMDLLTVDVSKGSPVQPGDTAVLFGEEETVNDMARDAGTIAYELLSRLGPRVRRVYGGV